jgi:mannose-6-phosphate isomerase-like protein (cupin superfamily)
MQPQIFQTQESSEYYTPERCYIIEIMNQPGIDFSIARAKVEPGVSTALHSLAGINEAYYILSGNGLLQWGNTETRDLGPGDIVLYLPGSPQTITNVGQVDLIFLCVCVPRFTKEAYINLEETGNQ